ncbi:hypothetical protein SAMN05216266_12953 [Amycolatopsis marina]|uniref:Uncharacterized protein n=1 Tax=Amycolatopsis marina TaxID=490629 RepID=A0A1I1CHH8_9PSEU|nr:Rv3235 family protein [Amycolatopsis marina]SFB61984.1 hypothetical protein SAMN05216266_12953 [Amycolatopsis marina]
MRSQPMRGGLRPLRRFEPWVSHRGAIEVVHRQTRRRLPDRPTQSAEPPKDETNPAPALDPRRVHTVLAAIVEVYGGSRPVEQLRSAVSRTLYRQITLTPRTADGAHLRLVSMRSCRPTDRALEVSGRVQAGERNLAVVARFEAGDNGWQCVSFTFVGVGNANSRS